MSGPHKHDRMGFIGGTDVQTLMTGDEHKIMHLWRIKTGREMPDDLSDVLPVQLGIHTEPFNMRWFSERVEYPMLTQETLESGRIKGTLDGITVNGLPVECKHTNSMNDSDGIISTYFDQLQTYMHLAEADKCWLSVIYGNSRWEAMTVAFDPQRWATAEERIEWFLGHVSADTQPFDIPDPLPVDVNTIAINDMVVRDATGDNWFGTLSETFIETKAAHAQHEDAKKKLKAAVKPNEREVFNDKLTIKRDARGALRFTIKEDNQ